MRRIALALVVLVIGGAPSCVLVSSTSRPGPERDAGQDAGRGPRDAQPRDSAPRDAPQVDARVLTRVEATTELLRGFGPNVVLPTLRQLATGAATLEAATAAYAASGSDADRDAARAAWSGLMPSVQRAEMLQLGPAAMAVEDYPGGLGFRDRIYPWPINRCRVDSVVDRALYEDLAVLGAEPSYVLGLAAIEYLLFFDPPEHGCSPTSPAPSVDDAHWTSLGDAVIRERRADAAHAYAQLVRRAADELVAAWEPSGGDFSGQLARAGGSGSPYASQQAALNAIYWAIFYTDRGVKDMKLAVPAGISDLCELEPACPQSLESRWAGASSSHVHASLEALRDVYLGGPPGTDAIGFDDLLRSIGDDDLARDVELAIDDAITMAAALPQVDPANLEEHLEAMVAMHAAVRVVTDLIKMDIAAVFAFTPPPGAGEDND